MKKDEELTEQEYEITEQDNRDLAEFYKTKGKFIMQNIDLFKHINSLQTPPATKKPSND